MRDIINPFVFIATKKVLCEGPCFYIASKPESSFFFFYHRGIGIDPSNLELRLVISRDNNIVDLV